MNPSVSAPQAGSFGHSFHFIYAPTNERDEKHFHLEPVLEVWMKRWTFGGAKKRSETQTGGNARKFLSLNFKRHTADRSRLFRGVEKPPPHHLFLCPSQKRIVCSWLLSTLALILSSNQFQVTSSILFSAISFFAWDSNSKQAYFVSLRCLHKLSFWVIIMGFSHIFGTSLQFPEVGKMTMSKNRPATAFLFFLETISVALGA